MNRDDIIRLALEAGFHDSEGNDPPKTFNDEITIEEYSVGNRVERFANLVAAAVHEKYSPIGTVAGGGGERTFMHPSVKYILPIGLQLYARIEVCEEDKV